MIYVRAITEVLKLGGDIYDGNLVMSHIFNRSYHSIQGFDVSKVLQSDNLQQKKIKKNLFLLPS